MKNARVDRIIVDVADRFGLNPAALKEKSRLSSIVRARHLAMLVARDLTKLSFPELGIAFGGKDHTTIMSGVKTAQRAMLKDPWLQEVYEAVTRGHNNTPSGLIAELECMNAAIARFRARAAEIELLIAPAEARAAEIELLIAPAEAAE
jgi:hypothetical protein